MALLALSGVLCAWTAGAVPAESKPDTKWGGQFGQFDAQDKASPPAKGGLLFVGSSTIRLWDLKKSFPALPALNRGFGGSTLAELNQHRERLVLAYAPKTIVLYSGDNDVAHGASAEEVFGEFKSFAQWVREKLPEARLIVLSIKPSVARWKLWDVMNEANRKMREYAGGATGVTFLDCASAMMGPDGQPRKELLREDGLHLNEAGYALWAGLLAPLLGAPPATR